MSQHLTMQFCSEVESVLVEGLGFGFGIQSFFLFWCWGIDICCWVCVERPLLNWVGVIWQTLGFLYLVGRWNGLVKFGEL
jgi:hypothetical protein